MGSLLCSIRKQYLKQVNSPSSFTYSVLNLSFLGGLLFPSRVPLRRSIKTYQNRWSWSCYGNLLSDAPSSLFFGRGGGGGTGGIREEKKNDAWLQVTTSLTLEVTEKCWDLLVILVELGTFPPQPKQYWIRSKMGGNEYVWDHNIVGAGSWGIKGWTQNRSKNCH